MIAERFYSSVAFLWWCTPVIPALGKERQEDFKVSLRYIVNLYLPPPPAHSLSLPLSPRFLLCTNPLDIVYHSTLKFYCQLKTKCLFQGKYPKLYCPNFLILFLEIIRKKKQNNKTSEKKTLILCLILTQTYNSTLAHRSSICSRSTHDLTREIFMLITFFIW